MEAGDKLVALRSTTYQSEFANRHPGLPNRLGRIEVVVDRDLGIMAKENGDRFARSIDVWIPLKRR